MNLLRLLGVLGCLGGLAAADDLVSERLWTGINGRAFRGTFHQISADGMKAEFLTEQGKTMTVALANLIQADRERILNRGKAVPAANPTPVGDPAAFMPAATPNRTLVPGLDPKQFGGSTNDSLVDALWVSLLWWDQAGVLGVPKKGDLERKAEWLHKQLTRVIAASGGHVASVEEAKKGLEKYFLTELKELATCRTIVEHGDFSAARLAHFAQGANVVILQMSMTYGKRKDFTMCATLEAIDLDGKFAIHVFGRRFTGRLKPVKEQKDRNARTVACEYVLDRREDLPDDYARNEATFFMGTSPLDGVLVLKPYVYQTPGKPSPLPPDE